MSNPAGPKDIELMADALAESEGWSVDESSDVKEAGDD
jgi:hypothetical protein